MKRFKKIVAVTLAATMLTGMSQMSLSAFAATVQSESVSAYSGSCGDNVQYEFDESTGTLTISGTGAMADYYLGSFGTVWDAPWDSYKTEVKTVVIEEGITYIGTYAFCHFEECKIYIPKSVNNIASLSINQESTLVSCEGGSAESYSIENFNKFETTGEYFTASGNCGDNLTYTYDGNTKTLSLSGTGEMSYDYDYEYPWTPYKYCIESLVINEGITSFEISSIYNNQNIRTIDIPASLTKITNYGKEFNSGYSMFSSNKNYSLERFNVASGNINYADIDGVLFNADKTVLLCYPNMHGENYVIPDGVVSINVDAFYDNMYIKSIVMSDTVKNILSYAFSGCSELESIVLSKSLTSVLNGTFKWCRRLKQVSISEGVTSICKDAFYECSSLQSIVIPNGVTSIGEYAFYGCRLLQRVVIPDGVTALDKYTFYDCNKLKAITIPESVTTIDQSILNNNSYAKNDELVIYGVKGSAAQTYAEANNITFCDINEVIEPSVVGYSVSLGGDIGLNYFVALDYKTIDKDIKMTFVNEATGKEITTIDLYDSSNAVVDGKPYYKFTCPISASHMSDRVKAVLTIDGVSQELNVYSVKEYAETILGDEKYASAAPVVKAMLNYGAYSEIALLGVKTSDTNSALIAEEKQLGEVDLLVDDYSFMNNYDDAYADCVQYACSRISLKNETVIKHYFMIDESKVDPSMLHVYCDNKETTFVKDGEYYRVDIKGINAKDLYYEFYVNIDSEKDGVTISSWSLSNYSVLTYINSALNSSTISDEVKDTVKALYFFYKETNSYSSNS